METVAIDIVISGEFQDRSHLEGEIERAIHAVLSETAEHCEVDVSMWKATGADSYKTGQAPSPAEHPSVAASKDVPTSLDECIEALPQIIGQRQLEECRALSEADFLAQAHHGLGRWLRNNWGLWQRSENRQLKGWFFQRGVSHADDISGIILASFHRHLQGKPIDLEKQVAVFRKYWEERRPKNEN